MFEGRGVTLGNGFIFVQRKMLLPSTLDQVALCHSENDLTFREIWRRVRNEVNFVICQVFCRSASNIAEKT